MKGLIIIKSQLIISEFACETTHWDFFGMKIIRQIFILNNFFEISKIVYKIILVYTLPSEIIGSLVLLSTVKASSFW